MNLIDINMSISFMTYYSEMKKLSIEKFFKEVELRFMSLPEYQLSAKNVTIIASKFSQLKMGDIPFWAMINKYFMNN